MTLERQLAQISALSDSKDQTAKFLAITDDLMKSENSQDIKKLISKFMSDEVGQAVSKTLILHIAKKVGALSDDCFEDVSNHILVVIKQHNLSFDEAEYSVREAMFSYYVKIGLYKDAAASLAGVNCDSTNFPLSDEEKTDIHVRCAEAALQADETIDAEVYVNRASSLINNVPSSNWTLLLRYRVTYARVLDANRKFVEAAMRYYDISTIQNSEVDEEDLLELLGKAVTCAILGKTGPQRSRVLGLLYKDERIGILEQIPKYSGHSAVLNKVYANQLLRQEELTAFEASLMKHQTAVSSDGLTIFQRAVIEHNMLTASRIYDNIRFSELASLLRLDENRAEKVAAKMIIEDRLKAVIDQDEGILNFQDDSDPLLGWNDRIADLCAEVSECVERLKHQYPSTL